MTPTYPIAAAASGSGAAAVRVSTRHYFSSEHLYTAYCNAARSRSLEDGLIGTKPVDIEHRSAVMTTVIASVAFLEALINEIYADASDSRHENARIAALSPAVQNAMRQFIAVGQPRRKTLEKYDGALAAAGLAPFDHGHRPYQDADILIKLRNELTHYNPSWHDQGSPTTFELRLTNKFAKSSLLAANDRSPWPIWAISAGCAEWACTTARELADDWTARLGLLRIYESDMRSYGYNWQPWRVGRSNG